jgi:hypothetical protein
MARSEELEATQENRKTRVIALHIIVIVLEFTNGLLDARNKSEPHLQGKVNTDLLDDEKTETKKIDKQALCETFNQKLFMEHELLAYLIQLTGSDIPSTGGDSNEAQEKQKMNLLTLEEIKLMARIFASMIPETLIEAKIHVLEEDPKVVLQMGGELAASQRIKPNLL